MGGPNTGKYKSQSQRLQAVTDAILNKNKITPPTANGVLQRQPGRPLISSAKLPMLGASKKLNTPTKAPCSSTSAHGTAAGAGPRMSAQANATAGADAYDFPEDSEDEQMQAALAASRAAVHAGPAAQPVPKLRRIKTYADRQKRAQQEQLEQRQQQHKDQRNVRRQLNTDVDMQDAHSGDENTPACQSLLPFSNAATPPAAAVGSKPSTLPGDARARQQSAPCRSLQLGIRQFAVTQKPPAVGAASSQLLPAGMLNHGNTCYLNAILQALLSLPCLARDLRQFNCSSSGAGGSSDPSSSSSACSQLRLPPDGVTAAMVTCLQQYQAACSRARGLSGASTAAISPQVVREAMRKRASHWGAARQEDAHEFFTALLSGLADEVQQAQLEYMQKAGSTRRSQKARGAPAAAVRLALPSADNAAQACQAGDQADVAAAASIPLPDESQQEQEDEPQQQQQQLGAEQQPQQGEAGTAAEAAGGGSKPPSRSPTPACQLPSMSVSQALCPVTRNFLGCLQHTYTCSVCGKKTVQKEQFNHLILDLPQDDDSSSGDGTANLFASSGSGGLFGSSSGGNRAPVADLSSLLANHFRPESCDKACEGCGASEVQHTVEHAVRRLPRVLVVQLKRFKWVISKDGFPDCRKMPTPVRPDKQLFLGRLCVPGRPVPPLLAALMPPRLIRSAMEAAGEEPPAQHRLLSSSHAADGGNGDGCVAAAVAAAAVAEGGLGGLLQAGDGSADVVAAAAAAASGQHSDQEQKQKQPSKRLGSLRPLEDAQEPKKPRTVAGASFAGAAHHHTSDSSLARFWHNSKSGTSAKLGSTKPALAASRLKAPLKQQQLSSWEAPDLDLDDLLGPDVPPPLRRNNSSSAVPQVDLTGLADAADAAARDEFDRDLEQAIILSMQEEQQRQQQQQQQPSDTKQQGQGQWADADAAGAAGAHEDGSEPFPDWLERQYVPAEAAAPPASPVHAGSPADDPPADFAAELRRQQQQARQHRSQHGDGAQHGQSAVAEVDELLSCTPTAAGGADMAVADAIFAFTPPAGAPQRQQQPAADPMDLDAAGTGCTGPPSPALQAPQPDRSGRVSSSMAPGGSQLRPPGQKLGGRALSSGSTPAPLLAALQRIGKDQPKLLQEVQETGLTEEQQMARAIAESMRDHQQQGLGGAPSSTGGEAAAAASGGQQQPGAAGSTAEPGSAAAPMEVDGDVVLEDEEAILKRVLEESAAENERQQQQKLQQQQQLHTGEDAGADLPAPTAPAPAAEGAGAGAQAQANAGQGARKERPPALLLRLLEDSDYEAEQDELRRSRSRSSSPASTVAEGAAAAAGGSELGATQAQEQPAVQPKRRRGRPRKQQPDVADVVDAHGSKPSAAAPAAAAGAGLSQKQGVLMPRDHGPAATADGLHGAAAAGPSLQEDKENCTAATDAGADTDAVPDRSTGRAAGAAAAAAGAKAKPAAKGAKAADGTQRRALKEILGDGSARNAAAGAGPAAAAAEPPQKPPAVSAAVAASQAAAAAAAAAGRQGAATGAASGEGGGCGVQELQEGVAAGAVGSWPQDTAASYSLSAVVRHMGDLVSVGHFTSDVLNHEVKRWFHYDDSHVRPLNSIEAVRGACQRDGYLFFYVNDAIAED